jgi:ubiquinone/menaquinone biosynthesis C-methylase UbiE
MRGSDEPHDGSARDALPEAEQRFTKRLEEWFVAQGVPRSHPLFDHWVRADGIDTYWASQRIVREISTMVALEGRSVLDVGCGFGGFQVAASEAGATCAGVEIVEARLRMAVERITLHGQQPRVLIADAFKLPFRDESFDVVVSSEVLEHVKSRDAFIGELSRVLRRGGVLYLAFPNLLSLRNVLSDPHYRLPGATLLPTSLANLYTRAVRKRSYDVEILPFVPYIKRLCVRHGVAVHAINASEDVLIRKIDEHETIDHPVARRVVSSLRAAGLTSALKSVVHVRAAFGDHVALAGTKKP